MDCPAADSLQGRIDFENGRQGDVLFVNGEVVPAIAIRSGEVVVSFFVVPGAREAYVTGESTT